MPINNWKHKLFMTDVFDALKSEEGDFGEHVAELVKRIREAEFYDEDDIVLRNLVNDMESAGSLAQLGRDLDLFMLWCNQGQQVWVEHILSREKFEERDLPWGNARPLTKDDARK